LKVFVHGQSPRGCPREQPLLVHVCSSLCRSVTVFMLWCGAVPTVLPYRNAASGMKPGRLFPMISCKRPESYTTWRECPANTLRSLHAYTKARLPFTYTTDLLYNISVVDQLCRISYGEFYD
jgi:hypothetical protein